MSKRGRVVSANYVKKEFTTIGMILCLYVLLVLYLPVLLSTYFRLNPLFTGILNNDYFYVGIIYFFFVLGNLIPILTLVISSKVKIKEIWRKTSASFSDIMVDAVVFLAVGTGAMFLMTIISTYLPTGQQAVSPIGLGFQNKYLSNWLYLFLFIIVSPLLEEFAFRGVLLRSLGRYGNRFATAATALFYALSHVAFAEMLPAFVMSVFLTKMTLRYRSIQPSIIVHMLFNGTLYLFSCVPGQYYMVVAVILFLLYFLAIILVVTRRYHFVQIKNRTQTRFIWHIFLTRPSIIFAILLVIGHSLLMTFL